MNNQNFEACIDACVASAVECNYCATASIYEGDLKTLTKCIQLERECAAICFAAANLMSIGGDHAAHLCQVCAEICKACADECEKHTHMEHCKKCAAACRKCAAACTVVKKLKKKSSTIAAYSAQRSAVESVRADSSSDILGSSDLINTGPVADY